MVVGGAVIGAIAVSGAPEAVDMELAALGAAAMTLEAALACRPRVWVYSKRLSAVMGGFSQKEGARDI